MGEEARPYSTEDYREFKSAIFNVESRDQMQRINGRLAQRALVARLGKEICDLMWDQFQKDHPND